MEERRKGDQGRDRKRQREGETEFPGGGFVFISRTAVSEN